ARSGSKGGSVPNALACRFLTPPTFFVSEKAIRSYADVEESAGHHAQGNSVQPTLGSARAVLSNARPTRSCNSIFDPTTKEAASHGIEADFHRTVPDR